MTTNPFLASEEDDKEMAEAIRWHNTRGETGCHWVYDIPGERPRGITGSEILSLYREHKKLSKPPHSSI